MIGHSEAAAADNWTDIQVFLIDVRHPFIQDIYYKLSMAILGQLKDAALLVTEAEYFVLLVFEEQTGNDKNTIYLAEYSEHDFRIQVSDIEFLAEEDKAKGLQIECKNEYVFVTME